MRREGLVWENGPNVSANANSSDSHYEPTAEKSASIREGDFVLIDIWGRLEKAGSVFYDITWTGVVGREPTEREQLVFETVRNARDAAITAVDRAFAEGHTIHGFEADDAARAVIVAMRGSATSSPIALDTISRRKFMVPERIWITSKRTTSGCCCPIPAFRLSRESICPSLACAARWIC